MLRVVVTLNAVGLNVYRRDNFEHPVLGALVVAGLVAWSAIAVWAYGAARRRTPMLLGADLAVAVAAMVVTGWVKGPDFNATIPGFWVMGALMAWAIHWHWRGGLAAGAVLSVVDLTIRDSVSQANYGNVFLLMIGGPIVGYMCASLTQMAIERDAAERSAAAAAERARLARAVHDGVLQVLALVQRRGAEAGGDLAELGRLAGEQERSLRSLIRQQAGVPSTATSTSADLAVALERLGAAHPARAEIVTPGVPVLLASHVVEGLTAVVGACLDNVAAHVGEQAPAWVLLEAEGGTVTVSVRDNGAGIEAGRLAQAQAEGRLGVASSIRGRVAELGGQARLETGPQGTEWEFTVAR